MNSRLSNLSTLLLLGSVARLAAAQSDAATPAVAAEPKGAPPPSMSASSPETAKGSLVAATPVAAGKAEVGKDQASVDSEAKDEEPQEVELPMGLSPGAFQSAKLPGGVTPALGQKPLKLDDWRFDLHGFVSLPLRVGLGERERAYVGQKRLTLHTPPRVPGDSDSFEYTSINPDPWVQLNFSYGNSFVSANIIVAARAVADAMAYFNPPDQMGINDAYLTFRLHESPKTQVSVDVGAFANRYGQMGEYDLGRYGTPLIARVNGLGATATARYTANTMRYVVEAGMMGQMNKAPVGVESAGWNGFSDSLTGTSFALHAHAAAEYARQATLGLHYISTFVQDDRAAVTTQPDGSIQVYGAEARWEIGHFGHLYGGFARTEANDARHVSSVIRILNTAGGPGLMREYLGPGPDGNVNGALNTVGFEYDLSLGNLLRYPRRFDGRAPDVSFGVFGMVTRVESEDEAYDGVNKLKYGMEGAYSLASWFAFGARYDRVLADTDDSTRTHAILTGRAIFRTDWQAQDQLVLQYSRYFIGSGVAVKEGYPPAYDPSVEPDADLLALTATLWW